MTATSSMAATNIFDMAETFLSVTRHCIGIGDEEIMFIFLLLLSKQTVDKLLTV